MSELPSVYGPAVLALGAAGGLLLLQLVVADVAGIRAGHVPGAPVATDHASFLFRAVRAHANTNESVAAFVLLLLFAMLSSASPAWVNGLAWAWVGARAAHTAFYWADVRVMRSVAFGVSLTALVALLAVGLLH